MKKVLLMMLLTSIFYTTGCRKQVTTLQEPVVATAVDTSFSQPKGFDDVDTSDEASFTDANLDAEMQRLVQENMKPIYFGYNSAVLSEDEKEQLAIAGSFLLEHSEIRVLIEGHCDERGSSEYNMGLGENRAKRVKEYLVNFGIKSIRFETTSWGKERPQILGCNDEACHKMNRRAEFKIIVR